MLIDFDLENSPLEIRTNSVMRSHDQMALLLFTRQNKAVQVLVSILSSPQYTLSHCKSWTDLPTSLPHETDKIWRITLSTTSSLRFMIHCNNKEVLNVVLSDTLCSNNEWSDRWNRVRWIQFLNTDSASDYYRPGIHYTEPKN